MGVDIAVRSTMMSLRETGVDTNPMSRDSRRPTLADVARLAGTSTAVVSYVVNQGPRPVAPLTRERVQRAIEELDYRRNPLAGALVVGQSNLVGLLVPDSSNAFFGEISRQIEQEGKSRGLLTLLGNTAYDPDTEIEYENAMSDLLPRGIFVTSISARNRTTRTAPRIYLHSKPRGAKDPSVTFDDIGGGVMAVRHLLDHGFDDIHCFTGPDDFGPSGQRRRGWEKALTEAGVSTEGRLHRAPYDRSGAEVVAQTILNAAQPPRAIFATTDEQALAILRVASLMGFRVPEDLAVVGFDGIREALHGSIRLTTIALPVHELAAKAYELLIGWDDPRVNKNQVLPGSLIIGETCGC